MVDKLPTSTGAGFLNHQQYQQTKRKSKCFLSTHQMFVDHLNEHPLHHQWHPIPSPTTSWSWPFFPSTSCKWRCYLPKIPLTNPTCERRTMAHRSSQSTSSSNSKMWVLSKNRGIYLQIIYIFLMKLFHGKKPSILGYFPPIFWKHCHI